MGTAVFWSLFLLLVAALIYSTIMHERTKKERLRKRISEEYGAADVNGSSSERFDREPDLFGYMCEKNPDAFVIDDITANDLDLRDVYSRMNRCITPAGSDYLYCMFRMMRKERSELLYDKAEIFINDKDVARKLLMCLSGYRFTGDRDCFGILMGLKDASGGSIAGDIGLILLLVLSVILSALYPMQSVMAIIILVIISIGTYFSGRRKMEENLQGLALALKLIKCAKELSDRGYAGLAAYRHLMKLRRGSFLISYKDQTTSDPLSIIFDYVRMITHIDLIAYKLRISGIRKYSDELLKLYEDIGKADAALALASYLIPRTCCRSSSWEEYRLSAKELYHPLVTDCVCNDIEAGRGILITGSNASGKSTFLKAVGISLLFSRSMGFAFSKKFETGPFTLYTSMALSDNILKGESYYVVEARSLKRICDAADRGGCLCIIDEVLRGTNTVERIAASSCILKYLCRENVICIAATHDLELTDLLKEDMDLYHFTEEIRDDDVVFPFIIKKGVSDRTNAIRLLNMLGFDKGIVSSASGLVDKYRDTGLWT